MHSLASEHVYNVYLNSSQTLFAVALLDSNMNIILSGARIFLVSSLDEGICDACTRLSVTSRTFQASHVLLTLDRSKSVQVPNNHLRLRIASQQA